eukprot:CAMPEP_0118926104 /NCGR_PEP_ID=MMETSP1169-20130426/3882_1 /TAXON_ID=36882 /ORGANISM="Pyramimonas obovata, Strain CCMP722" /LENGTH=503 /DNA_ID=CAMNT_0006867593 /DNA_START=220 /DNA_END=1728 /DNA_ORIENTATION=+
MQGSVESNDDIFNLLSRCLHDEDVELSKERTPEREEQTRASSSRFATPENASTFNVLYGDPNDVEHPVLSSMRKIPTATEIDGGAKSSPLPSFLAKKSASSTLASTDEGGLRHTAETKVQFSGLSSKDLAEAVEACTSAPKKKKANPIVNWVEVRDSCKVHVLTLWTTLLVRLILFKQQLSACKAWIAGRIPLPIALFWSNTTNALWLASSSLLPRAPPKGVEEAPEEGAVEGAAEDVRFFPAFVVWTTIIDSIVFAVYAFKSLQLGIGSPEAGPDAWRYKLVGAHPSCDDLRPQIWRYVMYQFCHSGWPHIFNNIILQLVVGCSLEGRLGALRTALLYNSGAIAGAFACSFTDVYRTVLGASGGIYTLIGAHVANLMLNWTAIEKVSNVRRLLLLAILVGYDLLTSAFFKADDTSYAAHAGGCWWGFTCGLVLLRNITFPRFERPIKIVAFLLCGSFAFCSVLWICLNWMPANWSAEETYGAQSDAPCCWKELPYTSTEREW